MALFYRSTHPLSSFHSEAFLEPVPWKELGLYEYPQIIKDPMDLGTIKTKLSNGEYGDENEFRADMDLVWDNCMRFNSVRPAGREVELGKANK